MAQNRQRSRQANPAAASQISPQQTAEQSREKGINFLITDAEVRTWTPQTIQQMPPAVIELALKFVDDDKPAVTSRLLPPGMAMENFHNMLLREMDRRNLFGSYLYKMTVPPRPGEEAVRPNDQAEKVINMIRPQIVYSGDTIATGTQQEVGFKPTDAALYDAAITSLLFERYTTRTSDGRTVYPEVVLDRDVVTALKLPEPAYGATYHSGPITDVGRRTLGYAFASIDAINPLHNPDGNLLFALTPGITFGELQQNYCPSVSAMYQAGDQMNPRDAFTSGAIQGRVNDRQPQNTDPAIGITGPCTTPAATRPAVASTQR